MCSCSPTWIVFFVAVLTAAAAQETLLQIFPNKSRPILKEVGSNLLLTCRPSVPDSKLVTNLAWRDPTNKKIATDNIVSPYVQRLPSGEPVVMLIFNGLTEQQVGSYSCHADYANTEHLNATVEVNTFVDVDFVEAPAEQYTAAGQKFKVMCKVKGNPYPIIEWYKGDQLIENSDKFILLDDGLWITNVTEQDDGVYKCAAMVPSTGAYKTRNIKVGVQVPPQILPIKEISVVEGEEVLAKCSASGKPRPRYTWIKLDRPNDLSKTDRFDVNKLTGELIINRVDFADNGGYKCVAINQAGKAETIVNITVLVTPHIYELRNVTARIGSETNITCKVKGRPPPRVTFRKLSNSEPYRVGPQDDDPRIVLEEEFFEEQGEALGRLIISILDRSDDGLYQCIGENIAGEAYKNGHIQVQFKPRFKRTKNLPPIWIWNGRPGNLTCLPKAIPNATIVWRWNDIEISEENFNNGRVSRNNFEVIGRGPQSTLIIKPYGEQRYYTHYECIARNELGEASIKIPLKQGYAPKSVKQASAHTVTPTSIEFDIVYPSNYDELPVTSYSVQYKPELQPSWDNALMHSWSFGFPYILERLIPEVTYQFRFAAENDVGRGPWTRFVDVTMPLRSVPTKPTLRLSPSDSVNRNLSDRTEVACLYPDDFELRWNVPANNGAPIDYYSVRACKVEIEKLLDSTQQKDCSENTQSVQYTNFKLDRLLLDTLYRVEVQAHNAIGDSSPAEQWLLTARDELYPSEYTDDEGKCVVKNKAREAETIVNITNLVRPQIYELWNITAKTGREASITCKVKGRPPPRVTFRKLSNLNHYRVGRRYPRIEVEEEFYEKEGESLGRLILFNVVRADHGMYQCVAENQAGKAYKNIHIQVWFKPMFDRTKHLSPVWSWDDRPVNLTCLPEAIPNATIVWRWNEIEISEENFNNGRVLRNTFEVIGRGPQSTLIVKPTQPNYYTHYECIARNEVGEARFRFLLKQGFVPGPVDQVRAHSVTPTTIKFEILPPSDNGGLPLRSYSVQYKPVEYKPESQRDWDNYWIHSWSYGSPYILEGLIPEETYQFRFAAGNEVGRGPWINIASMTMPRLSVPAEPTFRQSPFVNRSLGDRTEVISPYSDRFELLWYIPADNGEPIEYYLVHYCTLEKVNGNYKERNCSENIQQSVQFTNFKLDQLSPDTLYKVELRAHNAIGDSSPAQMWIRTAFA